MKKQSYAEVAATLAKALGKYEKQLESATGFAEKNAAERMIERVKGRIESLGQHQEASKPVDTNPMMMDTGGDTPEPLTPTHRNVSQPKLAKEAFIGLMSLRELAGSDFTVTSAHRPGDGHYHGSGHAIDFGVQNQDGKDMFNFFFSDEAGTVLTEQGKQFLLDNNAELIDERSNTYNPTTKKGGAHFHLEFNPATSKKKIKAGDSIPEYPEGHTTSKGYPIYGVNGAYAENAFNTGADYSRIYDDNVTPGETLIDITDLSKYKVKPVAAVAPEGDATTINNPTGSLVGDTMDLTDKGPDKQRLEPKKINSIPNELSTALPTRDTSIPAAPLSKDLTPEGVNLRETEPDYPAQLLGPLGKGIRKFQKWVNPDYKTPMEHQAAYATEEERIYADMFNEDYINDYRNRHTNSILSDAEIIQQGVDWGDINTQAYIEYRKDNPQAAPEQELPIVRGPNTVIPPLTSTQVTDVNNNVVPYNLDDGLGYNYQDQGATNGPINQGVIPNRSTPYPATSPSINPNATFSNFNPGQDGGFPLPGSNATPVAANNTALLTNALNNQTAVSTPPGFLPSGSNAAVLNNNQTLANQINNQSTVATPTNTAVTGQVTPAFMQTNPGVASAVTTNQPAVTPAVTPPTASTKQPFVKSPLDFSDEYMSSLSGGKGPGWGGVAQFAGAAFDNIANAALINQMKGPQAPVLNKKVQLNTDYNINPQLENLSTGQRSLNQGIDQSNISQGTANKNKLAAYVQGLRSSNELYGQKANIEGQLQNQQSMYNAQIDQQNNALLNRFQDQQTAFDNSIVAQKAQNWSNLGADVMQMSKDKKAMEADKLKMQILMGSLGKDSDLAAQLKLVDPTMYKQLFG